MNDFIGKWRITEMEQWDQDYIDLVEPGCIELNSNNLGRFLFGTVEGFMDFRIKKVQGKDKVEFSWEGGSEYDSVSGRGWFELSDENNMHGMLFIHMGDESWIKATRN